MAVPGPERRDGDAGAVNALGEPEDERGVDEADEGRGAFDGGALAGAGVTEAEELLEVAEADLDRLDANLKTGR